MPCTYRQGDLPKLDLPKERDLSLDMAISKRREQEAVRKLRLIPPLTLISFNSHPSASQQQSRYSLCFSRGTVTVVDNLGLSEEQRGSANDIVAGL